MKATFTIPGRLPGLNELINKARTDKYAAAKQKADVDGLVMLQIKRQMPQFKTDKQVDIVFTWIEPNKRRDKDNICSAKKFILDSLQKAGTIRGDGWKHIRNFRDDFAIDKRSPGVTVEITEVELTPP